MSSLQSRRSLNKGTKSVNLQSSPRNGGRFMALAALLFALYALDFFNAGLSETVISAPLVLLLVALLDTAMIALVIARLRLGGWRLGIAIFLLLFGLKTFLVAIEAIYLSDILPASLARALFVNGFVTATIFAPVAVWLLRPRGDGSTAQHEAFVFAPRTVAGWVGRLLLAGILYLVLFIGGGLAIFTPLAAALDADGAAAYSAAFEAPAWLPLFILLRGIVWALLALPVIGGLAKRSWSAGLILGLAFAVLMANNLLFPGDIAPSMRAAHFAELFIENLLYGLLLVWLFARAARRGRAVVSAMNDGPESLVT